MNSVPQSLNYLDLFSYKQTVSHIKKQQEIDKKKWVVEKKVEKIRKDKKRAHQRKIKVVMKYQKPNQKILKKLCKDVNIRIKWLNSNILFVGFSSNVRGEFSFSFPSKLPEPHYLIYNLREEDYESKTKIVKYNFDESKNNNLFILKCLFRKGNFLPI